MDMALKLSPAQNDIIWKMQHGRQLVKHGIFCGNPSFFTLGFPDQTPDTVDKRSVNGLVKRGLIEFAEHTNVRRTSVYRLTAAGRKVVTQ